MGTSIWGTNTDNTIPSINISRAVYIISDNSASESPEQVKKEDNKDGSKYKMRVVQTRSATLHMTLKDSPHIRPGLGTQLFQFPAGANSCYFGGKGYCLPFYRVR